MSRKTVLKKLDAIGFDELNDFLAETVHTSFRKGCDGGGSDEVWSAIRKMDPAQWDGAIKWMVWALRVSTGREERTVSNVVSLEFPGPVTTEQLDKLQFGRSLHKRPDSEPDETDPNVRS
jgi:hypothetical protein